MPPFFFLFLLFLLDQKKKQKKSRLRKKRLKIHVVWPEEKKLALSFIKVKVPKGSSSFFFQMQAKQHEFLCTFLLRPIPLPNYSSVRYIHFRLHFRRLQGFELFTLLIPNSRQIIGSLIFFAKRFTNFRPIHIK